MTASLPYETKVEYSTLFPFLFDKIADIFQFFYFDLISSQTQHN